VPLVVIEGFPDTVSVALAEPLVKSRVEVELVSALIVTLPAVTDPDSSSKLASFIFPVEVL
jgi:hypothetical protein